MSKNRKPDADALDALRRYLDGAPLSEDKPVTPEKLGRVDPSQRSLLVFYAGVVSTIRLCRMDPEFDCSLAINTLLSAAELEGIMLTVPKLAAILNRPAEEIRRAIRELKECHLLLCEGSLGEVH